MNFQEVASLVVFLATIWGVIGLVLFPITIRLRSPAQQSQGPAWLPHSLTLSYCWVPVIGVLLSLAFKAADAGTLLHGIIGDDTMKPYGIVILFLAIAYISTSLDMTGLFAWLALHITRLSKGNGMALFLLYFGLSSIMTVFTSNDVCIMTLTPIIYYFAAATSADPIPFLSAEFTAANIWSMLLFVGNPTNIIVAMAYQLSFAEYSKWMALPTLAAGFSCLAVLLLIHAKHIPKRLVLPDVEPAVMLVDKLGAVLGSCIMLACLGLLAAGPALGWELWLITLVCAGLHASYNFLAYVVLKGRWCRGVSSRHNAGPAAVAAAAAGGGDAAAAEGGGGHTGQDAIVTEAAAATVELMQQQQQQQQPGASCRSVPGLHSGTPAEFEQQQQQQQRQQQQQQQQQDTVAGSRSQLTTDSRTMLLGDNSSSSSSHWPRRSSSVANDAQVSIHSSSHQASPAGGAEGSPAAAPEQQHQQQHQQQHPHQQPIAAAAADPAKPTAEAMLQLLQVRKPSFWWVLKALPWEVCPFVLGMFVLVQGLADNGWIDRIAAWLGGGVGASIWAALFAVGALSVLLANIINNQPMTILMTQVCMSAAFAKSTSAAAAAAGFAGTASASAGGSSSSGGGGVAADAGPAVPAVASAFAVVVASNVAANYTVMGALAGIMFLNILRSRGLSNVGYVQFSKLMLPAGVTSTVVALLVLGAEFTMWR